MKSKKGFTLIELLAVIVILAIIALIATPIVLNIINNSKESSAKESTKLYLTAVEQSVAHQLLNNTNGDYDGTYEIVDNGKNIQKGNTKIKVSYEGKGLESGRIIINNGSVEKLYKGKIGNDYIQLYNNKMTQYQIKGESTLVTGSRFRDKVLSLTSASMSNDNVTYIGFYSNGNLPEGYTKEELETLENVSVSDDNKVKMYYDSEKKSVYVYSENQIYANENSSYMFGPDLMDMSMYSYSLKEINLLDLDTSRVTDMARMFSWCYSLTTLDLSSFDTTNVTDMSSMFQDVKSLTTLDLSNFDTSNVTDMYWMFAESDSLTEIIVSDKWVINEGTNTEYMFAACGTDHVTVK